MTTNTEEVRPEEGTPKAATATTKDSKKSEDPRQGKPRKVISWLKSCNSEETLATLDTHSRDELDEILSILDKLQEKTNIALDNKAEQELEDDQKQLKLLEEEQAKLIAKIKSDKERVAKKKAAEKQ